MASSGIWLSTVALRTSSSPCSLRTRRRARRGACRAWCGRLPCRLRRRRARLDPAARRGSRSAEGREAGGHRRQVGLNLGARRPSGSSASILAIGSLGSARTLYRRVLVRRFTYSADAELHTARGVEVRRPRRSARRRASIGHVITVIVISARPQRNDEVQKQTSPDRQMGHLPGPRPQKGVLYFVSPRTHRRVVVKSPTARAAERGRRPSRRYRLLRDDMSGAKWTTRWEQVVPFCHAVFYLVLN